MEPKEPRPLTPPQSPEAQKEIKTLAEEGSILGARDRMEKEKKEKKMTRERKAGIRQKALAERGILAAKDAVAEKMAEENEEKRSADRKFLEEKKKRLEEERVEKLESARSLSDIRLRYEQADYVDQEDSEQKRLNVTEEQVEGARKEMEKVLYKREHGSWLKRAAVGAGGAIGGLFAWIFGMIAAGFGWLISKGGKKIEKHNPWKWDLK